MLQEAGFLTVARNRLLEVISDMAAAVCHFESIFTFPNSFSSQHLLMEQEDRVRVFVSLLELLPLISMSSHSWFLSFFFFLENFLRFPFSVFFIVSFSNWLTDYIS